MAMRILEKGGTMEDAQVALGHRSRKTTEKYYTEITKRRAELANGIKRELWNEDPVVKQHSLVVIKGRKAG
jgi:integrase